MKKIFRIIRNIYWLYSPYVKHAKPLVVLSIVFCIIVMPFARIISVYLPELIMDALSSGSDFSHIFFLILSISIVQLAIPVYEDILNVCVKEKYHMLVESQTKRKVYEHAQRTDYEYIDSPSYYNDYSWAINEYSNKCKGAFSNFEMLLSSIGVIAGLFVAVLSSIPWTVLIAILNITFRTWGYLMINRLEVEREEECVVADRKRDYIHRIFYSRQYAMDLKGTNLSCFLLRDYDLASGNRIGIIKKYAMKIVLWAIRCDAVYRVSMIAITTLVAYSIYIGEIANIGSYITIMLTVERLDECLYELFEVISQTTKLDLYAERIKRFFDRKSTIETSLGEVVPDAGAFSIDLRSVSFGYNSSNFSIRKLDLSIKRGEKIAIVGENGAGKSTLLKLLLRLYDVDAGCIQINGHPIQNYNLQQLRNKIGVAFQDTNIYALSIKENFELYQHISDGKFSQLLEALELESILAKSGAAMETEVTREFSDDGIELSGGESQKLAIGRVFSHDFGLLILDEPSSALDPFAEHKLTRLIMDRSNKTTTIIIAHRLSTVKEADRIVLMENGEIKEVGTHNELISKKGRYYEMYTLQAEKYK